MGEKRPSFPAFCCSCQNVYFFLHQIHIESILYFFHKTVIILLFDAFAPFELNMGLHHLQTIEFCFYLHFTRRPIFFGNRAVIRVCYWPLRIIQSVRHCASQRKRSRYLWVATHVVELPGAHLDGFQQALDILLRDNQNYDTKLNIASLGIKWVRNCLY